MSLYSYRMDREAAIERIREASREAVFPRLSTAAATLWVWLSWGPRDYESERECLHVLTTFEMDEGKLSKEEARAALAVGLLEGLFAVNDAEAVRMWARDRGGVPPDRRAIIVRFRREAFRIVDSVGKR